MTIAETGNRIVDAQARRGAAEAKLSESRKAAAARKAAKAGKAGKRAATSRSRKSSGKAAAGRGGRGIVIKKSKSGKGFGGLMNYMMDDPSAKLILSNAGHDKKSMSQFMRTCATQNPKVTKPTGHIIVALPEGVRKSEKDWQKIVTHITEEMELGDHPFAAVLHSTDKGQDLHICFSKVDMSGNTYNDSNDKYLMAAAEQSCEQKFKLKLVPYSEMKSRKADTPDLTLGEVRQAERTGLRPPRMVVSDAIKSAKQNKPTPLEFIKRLRAAGVAAVPYVHQDQVKGFSFSMDGKSFKGKDVSASWTKLEKELDYVENRDIESLAVISREARESTIGLEPTDQPTSRPAIEVQDTGQAVEQITPEPARKTPTAKDEQAPEPIRQTDRAHPAVSEDDPIYKKVKAQQELLAKLRAVEGDRKRLALDLADRIKKEGLYPSGAAHRDFMKVHPTAEALGLLREFVPDTKARLERATPNNSTAAQVSAPVPVQSQSQESKNRADQALARLKADQAKRDAVTFNQSPTHAAPNRDNDDWQLPSM